jgi:hypothetical protein
VGIKAILTRRDAETSATFHAGDLLSIAILLQSTVIADCQTMIVRKIAGGLAGSLPDDPADEGRG